MKVLVSLACILAVAFGWEHHHHGSYHGPQHIPVIHKGVPIETPEVQHAKQAHYAALAAASHHVGYDDGEYKHYGEHSHNDDGQYTHHEPSHYDDGQYKHHDESHYDDGQYKHHDESHYNNGHDESHYNNGHDESHYNDGQDNHYYNKGHHAVHQYGLVQIPAYETTHVQPKISHDGKPLDTPEVEAAKAHHFAAVHEALSRTSAHGSHYRKRRSIESYDFSPEIHYEDSYPLTYTQEVSTHADDHGYTIHQEHAQHYNHGYYTHELPKIGHDGKPLDTPEVELAKLEHLAAHQHAKLRNAWAKQGILPYEGLVDTPEVEHAKAAHFAAYAKAAAKTHHHYY